MYFCKTKAVQLFILLILLEFSLIFLSFVKLNIKTENMT